MLKRLKRKIIKEIKSHPTSYILLTAILLAAFFVRVYRLDQLIGFYYDQGRDALVIWRFWHEGNPFLVGPVTGLAGILLGPFYYFLIAPFYLIGGGNPVYPAVFLAFLATLATFMLYYLGWKFHSRATGIIAAIIGSFSYYLVLAGRWLANPTPILLTSMLLFWSLWRIANGAKGHWWIIVGLLVGLSLQLEAASGFFYIPIVVIFALWQKKNLPDKKNFIIASALFFLTLVPQIIFNFVHDNILLNNFKKVLLEEKSFSADFTDVLSLRLKFFWDVFSSKILLKERQHTVFFALLSLSVLLAARKKLKDKNILPLFLVFFGVPFVGYILFQGNYGNIYDYYLTGYYFPMMLLFSLGLGILWKNNLGKLAVLIFLFLFLRENLVVIRNYIIAGVDGPTHITLGNEVQAVDWVFEDAKKEGLEEFNVDVYVPPVIPHSYDYLFLWRGNMFCGESLCGLKYEPQLPIVYVLYEVDPPHPERLENWLIKYKDTSEVEEQVKFGGVSVERRKRL